MDFLMENKPFLSSLWKLCIKILLYLYQKGTTINTMRKIY